MRLREHALELPPITTDANVICESVSWIYYSNYTFIAPLISVIFNTNLNLFYCNLVTIVQQSQSLSTYFRASKSVSLNLLQQLCKALSIST